MVLDLFELCIGIFRDCRARGIVDSTVSQQRKLVSVEEFRIAGRLLYVVLATVVHMNFLVALGAFGLHKHHAVGRTRTINGSGSGVLENGYALDVVRIKVGKAHLTVGSGGAEARNAVDNQQRSVVDSAHTDVGFARRAGVSGGLHHLQSGHLTGQCLVKVHHGLHDKVFGLDGFDGSRKGRLLLNAVSYDNQFVEHLLVARHLHVQRLAWCDVHHLSFQAHTRYNEGGFALGNREGKGAVYVGYACRLSVLRLDNGADNGLAVGIYNASLYGLLLCPCRGSNAEGQTQ